MNHNNRYPFIISSIVFFACILFLLVIIFFDLYFSKLDYTFKGVFIAHLKNPTYWLIYSLPFILGFIAYSLSLKFQRKLFSKDSEKEKELSRIQNIHNYIQALLGSHSEDSVSLDFKNDPVAKSLSLLKGSISKNKEEEILRRKEDEQRRWVSEGLAMFGEILRNNHDDINELSYNVISNLVKYTDSNQGALFILNDDVEYNKYFEITACYAYDRRKFAEDKIDFGEGLIGTCALEKQTICMTDIPDSYLRITSGLGKANPRSLLLVPLNINEDNHGVIEIASFNNYSQHQIEFIEKIAESVASTISGVKINLRTAKLLKESQEQAEIMAAQEEEMRQNMEELQATQEEAARQSERFVSFSNSVNNTLLKAEYDLNGNLIAANANFVKKLGYSSFSEIEGKNINLFISPDDKEWFDTIWIKIIRTREFFEGEIRHLSKNGKDLWMMAIFSQVYSKLEELKSILFLAIDSGNQKKQLAEYEGQLASLDRLYPRALFGIDGSVSQINEKFCNILGGQFDELKNKTIFDLVSSDEKDSFINTWESISVGDTFDGQIKFSSNKGSEIWLGGAFTALRDLNGEITRINFIACDLAKEKQLETDLTRCSEQITSLEEDLKQIKAELRAKQKGTGNK